MANDDSQFEALKSEYARQKNLTTITAYIFGFLALTLLLLLIAVYMLFGTTSANQSSVQSQYPLPCLEQDAKAVSESSISIRVLNGTEMSGFGTAVASALGGRGFVVTSVENYDVVNDTQIHFGANAVVQAYTLAGHFLNPTLILDDRVDGLIDVIVGRSFNELQDKYLVMTSDVSVPLDQPAKCVSILDIKPAPTITHDAKLIPAYGAESSTATGGDDSDVPMPEESVDPPVPALDQSGA
jgi:hypothetical protein